MRRTKSCGALYKELDDKNAALNESNAELDQFATIAGHDLQEPLRKVLAFGRMLTDEHGDALGGGGRDYLDRMQGASERMLELIGDLVRYARVTSQAKSFRARPILRIWWTRWCQISASKVAAKKAPSRSDPCPNWWSIPCKCANCSKI